MFNLYNNWQIWLIIIIVIVLLFWFLIGNSDKRSPRQYNDRYPYNSNYSQYASNYNEVERDNCLSINSLIDNYADNELDDKMYDQVVKENNRELCEATIDITPNLPPIVNVVQPTNHRFKKEGLCCRIMEELYGVSFTTQRPDFLKNPETKRNLELDCYNNDLKLAVEYNGEQHYKWPNFTGQTQEQFLEQVRRDEFKVNACDANGVYLITVPYTIPENKLREFITYYLPENVRKRTLKI